MYVRKEKEMSIELILGPPGTGKTTALLDLVDQGLKDNIQPENIAFISFTRKSVSEAVERAVDRFNLEPSRFRYFRTIHSLCYRQLGMVNAEVMQKSNYRDLGDRIGMDITGYINPEAEVYEMKKGDQMVFLESLARLCRVSYKDIYDQTMPDFSWHEFEYYCNAFIKYKESLIIYDFTDMLERFVDHGHISNLDLLFIDEAQDLCALQWLVMDKLFIRADKTYIAGDDDQAIFRWSGADVEHLKQLSEQFQTRVLDISYRIPQSVHSLAESLSDQIETRIDKHFEPRKAAGKVHYVNSLDDIDMDKGEWLILVRNSYLARQVITHLRMEGYVYESKRDNPLNSPILEAALSWEKLRMGKEITVESAKKVLSYMSKKHILGNYKKALSGRANDELVDIEKLTTWCRVNTSDIWHKALDKIGYEDREYFIAARKKGESFIGKPRIKVSTIHGAKGGEAQNVVVLSDISMRTYRGMRANYDDELRVFYVAVTRAKEELFILQPKTNYYFNI
jgi:DNA helicase II / ATP-dependent DNA helicase PcrA